MYILLKLLTDHAIIHSRHICNVKTEAVLLVERINDRSNIWTYGRLQYSNNVAHNFMLLSKKKNFDSSENKCRGGDRCCKVSGRR